MTSTTTGSAQPRAAERVPVDGSCPECGQARLERYPVMSADGWFLATKCQNCLLSVTREPWNRLGYVNRDHALSALGQQENSGE